MFTTKYLFSIMIGELKSSKDSDVSILACSLKLEKYFNPFFHKKEDIGTRHAGYWSQSTFYHYNKILEIIKVER